ncbi:Uncharacterised protein [Escherichia coli]|nr:Uncharacterised protein [Escherichia coli]
MQSAVLQILTHGNMCQIIAVKRSIAPKTGESKEITAPGDYPEKYNHYRPINAIR